MKLVSDSEQVYACATINHRPDTKPFDCDDSAGVSTGFKTENNMVKDYQNGVLCASEAKERDADGWTVTKLDRSMSLNDLTDNNEKKVGDLTAPYSHSCREIESFDDSVIYTDKNVMECELPELIVCYKESMYHVKDICVDEGVHSQDNNILESDINEKDVCILLPPEKDKINESMEENKKNDEPLPDLMKSSADNTSNVDKVYKCNSSPDNVPGKGVDLFDKDLVLTGKAKDDSTDRIANIVCEKMISLSDLLSMRDSVSENPCFGSSTKHGTKVGKGSSECSSGKAVSGNPALVSTTGESNDNAEEAIAASSDLVSAAEESNGGSEEAILANPVLNPLAEEKKNDSKEGTLTSSDIVSASADSTKSNNVDKLSYNSKVETGSITFDFDPSAPKAKGTEDCSYNGDCAPIEDPDTSKLEDAPRQSFSSQANGGLGESSFHVSGSLPGLITYSGPIAFSGNLSIRSDSSTTSTRSFAFPVLQSEWNSSPVRMAKPDRRHLRKHKCWRQGLLCCRF